MKTLKIEIDCGDKTCASEPGKFCKYIRSRKYGQIHFCQLWHNEDGHGRPLQMEEKDGWLLRRPECLACTETEEAEPFTCSICKKKIDVYYLDEKTRRKIICPKCLKKFKGKVYGAYSW